MDEELLNSNPYNTQKPTNTYGVQRDLKRHALKAHLSQEVQQLPEPEVEDLLEDDLMTTNPAIAANVLKEAQLDKSRYIKEYRTYYNIDSRLRQKYEEQLVPKDPNTHQYTREVC